MGLSAPLSPGQPTIQTTTAEPTTRTVAATDLAPSQPKNHRRYGATAITGGHRRRATSVWCVVRQPERRDDSSRHAPDIIVTVGVALAFVCRRRTTEVGAGADRREQMDQDAPGSGPRARLALHAPGHSRAQSGARLTRHATPRHDEDEDKDKDKDEEPR